MSLVRRTFTIANVPPPASGFTTWHITFGTYGARLHGGTRATVSRDQNAPGEPFIEQHAPREEFERRRARGPAVTLDVAQCVFLEASIPPICERGGWRLRTCAASPPPIDGDHVHVLLDVPSRIHGDRVRELIKRWLTQALDALCGKPPGRSWWAEGGSTKAVKNDEYRVNAHNYVHRQRTTPDEA